VDYCHRFNICHRDLKPENILLEDKVVGQSYSLPALCHIPDNFLDGRSIKHVKIADFGMSTLDQLNGLLRTSCGSPHYASPEIVRGHTLVLSPSASIRCSSPYCRYIGSASDIWSCGVVFFALCTSRLPFDDRDVSVVLRKVRDGRFTVPEWIAPAAKDLITRMLEVDLNKRITVSDFIASFWVTLIVYYRCEKSSLTRSL
jgi:serine/threonine protein kinase